MFYFTVNVQAFEMSSWYQIWIKGYIWVDYGRLKINDYISFNHQILKVF